jgi:Restriction endonuclease
MCAAGHDWQSCLAESARQLDALEREARLLEGETGRYIRPIMLVQVERTGKDQVDAGYIHAQDARAFLAQLGFSDANIREKTSEKDEIGDEELLSPTSQVRVIITKQALQEGWDCPFAYVLCALAASKGKRAMTQLVGRILRLPQVCKTGHGLLDACYVFCHNAGTGEVVKAIKQSLETEGMGDLAISVRGEGANDPAAPQPVALQRRAGLEKLRIFIPTVTWAEPGGARRPLEYDSDVLALLPWERVNVQALARDWKPGATPEGAGGGRVVVDLRVLDDGFAPARQALEEGAAPLDPAGMVRALLDIAPNPWLVWGWVDAVLSRLLQWHARVVGASGASLVEQLRKTWSASATAWRRRFLTIWCSRGASSFACVLTGRTMSCPVRWCWMWWASPKSCAAPATTPTWRKACWHPRCTRPISMNLKRCLPVTSTSSLRCAGGTATWRARSTACRAGGGTRCIPTLCLATTRRATRRVWCCWKPKACISKAMPTRSTSRRCWSV